MDHKLTLKFLDQCGFSLVLNLGYTWFAKGRGQQFKIPTRWSSQGHFNFIGTYSFYGADPRLEYRQLQGPCNSQQVIEYLDTMAALCTPNKLTVVVLDNAPFHKSKALQAKRDDWQAQGLFLRYLPAYSPHLNLIEAVWRKIKGFLMPRRCYNNLSQLSEAILIAFNALNATRL